MYTGDENGKVCCWSTRPSSSASASAAPSESTAADATPSSELPAKSRDTEVCIPVAVGLKGNSHQKINVANMIELLLRSFLVYHSPMFEAWKVP